jgi:predicted secreted protein
MAEIRITPGQSQASVTLPAGEQLILRVEEIPGTGFRWASDLGSSDALELTGSEFLQQGSGVGGGGERVFRFVAKMRGEVSFHLLLRREWMPDQHDRKISVHVRVQ